MFFTFKTTVIAVVGLLFAGQAIGAALIATDPVFACNCPNNCSYREGHSCKYYSGPSDKSPVISGHCVNESGTLTCVAS